MTTIKLITKINAPIQTVFDLARNIDIHQASLNQSNEKAIDGKTSGLIEKGETVTFRGKHFGIYLNHQSKITEMENPVYFVDEMIQGHFKSFRHEHSFVEKNGKTAMIDLIEYKTPFGIFGRVFDRFFLKKYLTKILTERNTFIQQTAENENH